MSLEEQIVQIVERVIQNRTQPMSAENAEARRIREQLEVINAKEYITVKEASFLLGYSESKLQRLIRDAKKGKTKNPIPYIASDDKPGSVTIFNRMKLKEWVDNQPKLRLVNNTEKEKAA